MLITRRRNSAPVVQMETVHAEPVKPKTVAIHATASTKVTARRDIERQLKLIADAERAIDDATIQIERSREDIERLLRLSGLESHTDGVRIASLIEQFTKQSRTIDPQKYRNAVAADVFWKTIDVSLTRAKEFITDKEIDAIADIVRAKSLGTKLVIKEVKRAK